MHKKVFKLLAIQVLFLFLTLIQLSFPSTSFASSLIGTHLGEGDIEYQISIINTILIPNGLEPGSPVTVMVPVTALQASQRPTVEKLAAAVSGGGFFPIVRINGVCEEFSAETGQNAAQTVDMARSIFGPEALIVWGNEINNKQNECQNWSKYVLDFIQIQGKPNVSPAALDYYMGLDDYKVATMFAQTTGMAAIYNTAPRAANAYGCIGATAATCYPVESGPGGEPPTNTQIEGYAEINGPVYLTEFSLSPGGSAPDAPDTDIKKVLEFIANRAAETGAVKVTPLVRNVCNNDSDWLLYINGKLFTPLGTEVSENCEGKPTGGYDTSIYPDYNINESQFYLSPIRNLVTGGSGTQRKVEKITTELAKQGYEAYCATENVAIDPDYNTEEKINRYFLDKNYVGPKVLTIDAVQQLSFTNAQYPLWRDVSDKQFLLSSLEEYFGFRDVYIQDPGQAVLTSAPINSLLSEPQLCVQGWKNLVEQQLACERLKDPSECELLAQPIPGTEYTVSQALALLQKYDPLYREGRSTAGCQDLVGGAYSDLGIIGEQEAKTLKNVLINVPTYFNRAYRYGFVVAVVHTRPPGGSLEKIFNFFTQSSATTKPRDEVLVAAFKLPDIGTNKGGGDDSGSQFWSDPLDLTRKLLTTKMAQYMHESSAEDDGFISRPERRDAILLNAQKSAIQNDGNKIYCYEGNFPNGTGTISCRNEMTKALVDIINGNAQGCGEAEPVKIIQDLAGLDNPAEPYGKVFNSDNGGEVMLNLFLDDETHPELGSNKQTNPQEASTNNPTDPADKLKSIFTLSRENKDNWDNRTGGTTVDFYIVYPMGYELSKVEEAMKGAFFTKSQLTELEKENLIGGFEMTGQLMGSNASSGGFDYIDEIKTENGECGVEVASNGAVTNKPCMVDVSVSLKQETGGVGILGAKLGFWMRKVQLQLNSKVSDAWDYFDSCKTTEEFMLGNCRGGKLGGGPKGGDTDSPYGYDTCGLDTVNPRNSKLTYCYPENLEPYFAEAGFDNPALEADKASRICKRESGGSPYSFNARCLEGTSVDYSIGLFQINMLPRCEGSFTDGAGIPDTSALYDPYNLPCSITDQERLNSCALSKVAIGERAAGIINAHLPAGAPQISPDLDQAVIDKKAEENIRAMVDIRKSHQNWSAWRTGACSIE